MGKERHAALARKNLEKKLGALRSVDFSRPRGGWIRAIRDALGISSRQLAERMSLAQSRIVALEQAEATGSTTLKSLLRPLDDILRERARKKAFDQYTMVAQGMLLENQALTIAQMHEEIDRLTDEILAEPLRLLWKDQ